MKDETCRCCGQLIPSKRGKRICAACGRQIGAHGKWFFGEDGRPHHRNCAQPDGYETQAQPTPMLLVGQEAP